MTDLHSLPLRMTTTEVIGLARISPATFRRRRASGQYNLAPVDRGAEDLYRREDVLRALGMIEEPVVGAPAVPRPVVDAVAIRAARAARGGRKPKQPI